MGDGPIRTEQLRKVCGSLVAVDGLDLEVRRMTEGLRTSLTPELRHMPVWAFTLALVGGTIGLAIFSLQTFRRRVVT